MAHISGIRIGSSIRALATASLLALAITSIPVTQVHAAQNNGGGTTQTGKNCINPDSGDRTIAPGTVWTSTTQNGQVASRYKCNGKTGEWDKVMTRPMYQQTPRAPMSGGVYAR